ncbi:MAG TPA: hydrogenase maturation protease [Bryobacteraceae bacterium]|nr:hydrogenase maturation protease [Bryobacteraceae bacterium]HOL72349.1 hydrogenase maturation protease [Bryobacteraceae bacterium]HOQ45921.1 hydrogenase maturation protease [Bryobacteraceae bacterium]HPU73260.1 hydrogenase maturation protease [Bryobacteraceae bacterium]
MAARVRVLGLGNELLADDAVGILAARKVAERCPPEEVEVIASSESGLYLLEYVTDVARLIVIDSVQTGRTAPGTIHVVCEENVRAAPGSTPHGTGLFDALALARKLGYNVPKEVIILAVEAADCLTIGGEMHPGVAAAIPELVERVVRMSVN